jgi:hypothetical protein
MLNAAPEASPYAHSPPYTRRSPATGSGWGDEIVIADDEGDDEDDGAGWWEQTNRQRHRRKTVELIFPPIPGTLRARLL